jgi:hypothetical protein
MLVETPWISRINRIKPGARRQLHDARANFVSDYCAREQSPAIVEYSDDLSCLNFSGRRVASVNPDWFAPLDFALQTDAAHIHLTMQPSFGLSSQEMKWIVTGLCGPEPFGRFKPGWMAVAVVVFETGNSFGEDFYSARWSS